ncbi:MAG: ComEC/Rec2 family competence protein [Prevotella sp.]|nr:ComEC/Rec2 family competence protein [Prevotella sp.]
MKIHAALLPLAVCLAVGIVLSQLLDQWTVGLALMVPCLLVTFLLGRFPRLQTIGIGVCFVLLGLTLGARSYQYLPAEPSPSALTAKATQVRQQLLQHYRSWGLDDEALGVVAAMTLGEKSALDRDLKDTYSRVGAAHILALSGLHLMIIYTVIAFFIGWRRFRIFSQVVIILSIWAFAVMVGMSPSVVRSAVMISLYALLSLGHRDRMSVNTLALTAIIMLAVNPQSLYSISFQLSFMAVLAILLFNPLFYRLVPLHVLQHHRWLGILWGLTTVSLSAQIGTAPLVAYYFGRFSTWFLLSNYFVIPLASAVLYLTLGCLATGWWTVLHQMLISLLAGVVVLMNRLLQAVARLPYSSIEDLHPTVWQVIFVYLVIGCGYVLLSLYTPKVQQNG